MVFFHAQNHNSMEFNKMKRMVLLKWILILKEVLRKQLFCTGYPLYEINRMNLNEVIIITLNIAKK